MPVEDIDARTLGVTFVNRFVLSGAPAEFEEAFARTAAFLAGRDGFLGYTLLQHVDDPSAYVNIARWRDAPSFHAAVADPAFGPHARELRAIADSEPNLYTPRLSEGAA